MNQALFMGAEVEELGRPHANFRVSRRSGYLGARGTLLGPNRSPRLSKSKEIATQLAPQSPRCV